MAAEEPKLLDRASLAERLAENLAQGIATGRWAVGERLPSETALGGLYGVGRSTVREAVRTLAARGQVEPRQGDGVYVRSEKPVSAVDRMLSRGRIADVFEARIGLEAEAARLAASRRSPAQLRTIERASARRTGSSAAGGAPFVSADLALHRAIVEAAGNPVILDLFDHFEPVLASAAHELVRFGTAADEPARADVDEHDAIVQAIRDRDGEAAARASRELAKGTLAALRASS
ncbi:FadR/GntR family transcriptional regulator [Leifsonia sp. NPDC058292]|uniref:FadR/GntR family transcriptional regulator n=1 Tax=Leifsonia sp. NPDC058292 TaxID=3346428 RepID=UPI0036D768AB